MLRLKLDSPGLPTFTKQLRAAHQTLAGISTIARVYSTGAVNPATGERYERMVQDDTEQHPIHRGRWQTVQSVADGATDLIESAMVDMVENTMDGKDLIRPVRALSRELQDRMKHYPPPLPNQRYIRTYRLRESWRYEVLADVNR